MKWDKLSMSDRAQLIKLGVDSGITDINTIKEIYNTYDEGGYLSYDDAGYVINNPTDITLHSRRLGSDAHLPDTYKTAYHPTFSNESVYSGVKNMMFNPNGIEGGQWGKTPEGNWAYLVSEDQMNNNYNVGDAINYITNAEDEGIQLLLPGKHLPVMQFTDDTGKDDLFMFNGVLPNITVKPDKKNKFDEGGPEDKLISTGNEWADIGMSFVPFVGTAMDIEEAIRNPTLGNIGWAAISTAADFLGGSLIKGTVKAAKKGKQAVKAIEEAEKATKRYERAVHANKVNPTKGTSRTVRRTYKEMKAAEATRRALAPTRKGRTLRNRKITTRYTVPMDNTKIINSRTVYGTDAVLNGIQNITVGNK